MKGYNNGAGHLAVAIIEKAVREWRKPAIMDYADTICSGDELLGFERCPNFGKCFSTRRNGGCTKRPFHQCDKRRRELRAELRRFFQSEWFEFLCGDADPELIRDEILGSSEYETKTA